MSFTDFKGEITTKTWGGFVILKVQISKKINMSLLSFYIALSLVTPRISYHFGGRGLGIQLYGFSCFFFGSMLSTRNYFVFLKS